MGPKYSQTDRSYRAVCSNGNVFISRLQQSLKIPEQNSYAHLIIRQQSPCAPQRTVKVNGSDGTGSPKSITESLTRENRKSSTNMKSLGFCAHCWPNIPRSAASFGYKKASSQMRHPEWSHEVSSVLDRPLPCLVFSAHSTYTANFELVGFLLNMWPDSRGVSRPVAVCRAVHCMALWDGPVSVWVCRVWNQQGCDVIKDLAEFLR